MQDDTDFVIQPERGKNEREIPQRGLLFVNPPDFKTAVKLIGNENWERRFIFNSNLYLDCNKQLFIAGPAVGAPMAVMVLEKLIALGAHDITVFGWAGGLGDGDKVGDIVLVKETHVGEGTSQYYGAEKLLPMSRKCVEILERLKDNKAFDESCRFSRVWSTDAPYMESRRQLKLLKNDLEVDTVDMECSALHTVARYRKIEINEILIISDLPLSGEWKPGYKSKEFNRKVMDTIELLIDKKRVGEI